ncbi:MAG: hypothetical protein KGJ77_12025 [Acidobacteriota bacterium]|nr:hypothetical protein [Acidobacteriota bacterium]
MKPVPGGRPALRVRNRIHVPDGPYRALARANAELAAVAVPAQDSPWEDVQEFALSYDGYGYWTDVAELAKTVFGRWAREGTLPASLDELRGCLFHELRRSHHAGYEPQGRRAAYVGALLGAIAALLDAAGPAGVGCPAEAAAG